MVVGRSFVKHPLADILKVGGTGTEIWIIGRCIAGDFRVHRGFPRNIRRRAAGDRDAGRCHQLIVLQHRDLEGDYLRGLGVHPRLQRSCVGQRAGDRLLQCGLASIPGSPLGRRFGASDKRRYTMRPAA